MLRAPLEKLRHGMSAISICALLYAAVPLMAFGFFWQQNAIILTGLDEQEANEIVVVLNEHGISAEKKFVVSSGNNKLPTWNLAVPKESKMESLALLNIRGLPRRRRGNVLLNLFSKQGLVSSDMEDKVRYQAGLADQIANTLRKLEGILDADVQLSIPQEDTLLNNAEEAPKVTAAVYIKHRGILDDPNAHMYLKIKRLVSSSIPGLIAENVTVIGDRALIATKNNSNPVNNINLVSVWGLHLDAGSSFAFKIIFGVLCCFLGLLLCLNVWLIWKISGILAGQGIRSLLSPSPFSFSEEPLTQEEPAANAKTQATGEKDDNTNREPPTNFESTAPEGSPISPSPMPGEGKRRVPRMPPGPPPRR